MASRFKMKALAGYTKVKDALSRKSISKTYKYMDFSKKHKFDIDTNYKYFMANYILILNYLKNDFKQKKLYDPKGKAIDYEEKISDELQYLKDIKKECEKKSNRFNEYKLLSNKLMFLKGIIKDYAIVLHQLQDVSGKPGHKKISIVTELKQLESISHLDIDIESITKSITKDIDGSSNSNKPIK